MVEAVRHLKVALVAEAVLQTVLQALGALEWRRLYRRCCRLWSL